MRRMRYALDQCFQRLFLIPQLVNAVCRACAVYQALFSSLGVLCERWD